MFPLNSETSWHLVSSVLDPSLFAALLSELDSRWLDFSYECYVCGRYTQIRASCLAWREGLLPNSSLLPMQYFLFAPESQVSSFTLYISIIFYWELTLCQALCETLRTQLWYTWHSTMPHRVHRPAASSGWSVCSVSSAWCCGEEGLLTFIWLHLKLTPQPCADYSLQCHGAMGELKHSHSCDHQITITRNLQSLL